MESKLQIELHNIDVLISKDLIDPAGKQIKRSKKKIFRFEKWTLLIQLINLEKQWFQKVGINQVTDAHFKRLDKELHLAFNRILHEHAYWYLFIELFKLHGHKVKLRKILAPEIKRLKRNALLLSPRHAKTTDAKLNYYRIHALISFMANDFKSAYKANKQFIKILDRHPHIIIEQPERYLSILNNYAMDCIGLAFYEDAVESVNKIKQLAANADFKKKRKLMRDAFRLSAMLDLNILVRTENYAQFPSLKESINEGLQQYTNQLGTNNTFTIHYLMAFISLENNDPNSCLDYLNAIIHHPESKILIDLQSFARIMSIVAHVKLENYNIIEYLISQTKNFIAKKRHVFKAESLLIQHFQARYKLIEKVKILDLISSTTMALESIKSISTEKNAFEYFNSRSWII